MSSDPMSLVEACDEVFNFVERVLSIVLCGHVSPVTGGLTLVDADLEIFASSLVEFRKNLRLARERTGTASCSTENEGALDDVVLACQKIADDLTARTQLLRKRSSPTNMRGQNGATSHDQTWPKEDFNALLKRVKAIKTELEISILPPLGYVCIKSCSSVDLLVCRIPVSATKEASLEDSSY